uniref:Uncharacterized protein n=3 Tax=Canis lupus TaxID=9612 RepID=A0A8P0TBM2_CANLF
MSREENPASKPTPVQDMQGDGRWMSLHHRFVADSKDKEAKVVFIRDCLVQLMHQCEIWRDCLGYPPVCRALHSLLLRLLAQDQGQGIPLPEATP